MDLPRASLLRLWWLMPSGTSPNGGYLGSPKGLVSRRVRHGHWGAREDGEALAPGDPTRSSSLDLRSTQASKAAGQSRSRVGPETSTGPGSVPDGALAPSADPDQAVSHGEGHRLELGVGPQLGQDVLDVRLHGGRSD